MGEVGMHVEAAQSGIPAHYSEDCFQIDSWRAAEALAFSARISPAHFLCSPRSRRSQHRKSLRSYGGTFAEEVRRLCNDGAHTVRRADDRSHALHPLTRIERHGFEFARHRTQWRICAE